MLWVRFAVWIGLTATILIGGMLVEHGDNGMVLATGLAVLAIGLAVLSGVVLGAWIARR